MTSFDSPWRDSSVTGPKLLVKISVTYPEDHTFYFSDGPIVDAGFGTGVASVGQATTARVAEIAIGSGTENGFSIFLENVKPYADNSNTDLGVATMVRMFSYFVFEGATVYLYQYASSSAASDDRTMLAIGSIESVTDLTPTTVTLTIREDIPHSVNEITARTVGDAGWYAGPDDVPDLSKGAPLPLRLGPSVYIPTGWEYWYNESQSVDLIHSGHQRASLVPARLGMVFNSDLESWDHQEIQSSILSAYGQASHAAEAYTYIRDTDSFSLYASATHATDTEARARGNHYWWHDRDDHYLEALLMPKRYGLITAPSAVINREALFDRRMDTVCTIQGHTTVSREVNLVIPHVQGLGGVYDASNSIQIWIYTLASQPPGTPGPATGTMQVGLGHPFGGSWAVESRFGQPLAVACNYTGWRASTKSPIGDEYPTRDVWRGTRFQRWDFSAASANDITADRDAYVYQDNTSENDPFTLRIRLVPANPAPMVHVLAIGLMVRYRQESEALYASVSLQKRQEGVRELVWDLQPYKHDYRSITYGPPFLRATMWIPTGRPAIEAASVDATEQTFAWHPGLHDGSDSYGSGGTWIESPGPIINYIATQYGKRGFTIGDTSTWGSVKWFDAMMSKWARIHNPSAPKFRLFYWQHDKVHVKTAMERIFAELPGMARTGLTDAGLAALICTTHNAANDEYAYAQHACTLVDPAGISADRDILQTADGALAFEQTRSSASEIINELEIHYQYDMTTGRYGAIAKCGASSSDDGFGSAWPEINGYAASEICGQSQARYTASVPRKKIIQLKYHWYPETAVAVGCWYLWRFWRPYVIVRFEAGLSCQDVMPGQIIEFHNDVKTLGGMGSAIPWTNTDDWYQITQQPPFLRRMRWHVLTNRRLHDPYPTGRGVYHEIMAMEHLSIQPAPGALSGGPVIAGEGFDGIL